MMITTIPIPLIVVTLLIAAVIVAEVNTALPFKAEIMYSGRMNNNATPTVRVIKPMDNKEFLYIFCRDECELYRQEKFSKAYRIYSRIHDNFRIYAAFFQPI